MNIEQTISHFYKLIDMLLTNEQYEICNSLFLNRDISDFDIEVKIGILTITNTKKKYLPDRFRLISEVTHILEKRSLDSTSILEGLF